MSKVLITWKCPHCGDKRTSDSSKRHNLDTCECGKCGVDAEEFYTRYIGDVEIINTVTMEEDD